MGENLPTSAKYVTTSLQSLFDETISQLIVDLGRSVVLYMKPTGSGCPNCGIGPDGGSNGIYNASNPYGSGPFNKNFARGGICSVCRGTHMININKSVTYQALIGRQPKELDINVMGGNPKNVYRTKMQVCAYDDIINCDQALIDSDLCVRCFDPVKKGLKRLSFVMCYWKKID